VAALTYSRELYEVLVVDQTKEHEPATATYLHKAAAAGVITWLRPPQIAFASLTKARNFGVQQAKRPDIIVFVDDDVTFEPDFLDQHVVCYANPEVWAVAGSSRVPGHVYPSFEPKVAGKVTWWGGFINNFYGKTAVPTQGFVGCNFSVRAEVLMQTGGFEERFIGNAMREETDLAVRIGELGGKIVFAPEARVVHHMVSTGGTRSEQRMQWYYAYFFNHFLFYRKHALAWRIPFFIIHMMRPLLACWLVYGRGGWKGFVTPWRGIRDGLRAARAAWHSGECIIREPKRHVF
jgi:GT2 family glycosyltransferase